jgi:hypothetical protein
MSTQTIGVQPADMAPETDEIPTDIARDPKTGRPILCPACGEYAADWAFDFNTGAHYCAKHAWACVWCDGQGEIELWDENSGLYGRCDACRGTGRQPNPHHSPVSGGDHTAKES